MADYRFAVQCDGHPDAMTNAHDAYRRWIHELWTGKPIAAEARRATA
jgi:hypothetical protein